MKNRKEYHKEYYLKQKENPEFLKIIRERNKEQYYKQYDNVLLKGARARARRFNLEFNLERSDIIIPDVCPVLKKEFEHNTQYVATLDRVDNSKGYVKGNVQVISRRANLMKNDATPEELIEFAKWVLETYGDPEYEYQEALETN